MLPDFASHEMVYLMEAVSASSDGMSLNDNPKYVNKIVAPTMGQVKAIGGFGVLPDYSLDAMPDDYAALVLVGGFGWLTPVAAEVEPIVRGAVENGKIVGAICNGASFMARCGLLNGIRHTGNGIDQLRLWGGAGYDPQGYIHRQAVSDRRIVTANGSAVLEFTKEMLLLLENDTPQNIEAYYRFNKDGFCALTGQ